MTDILGVSKITRGGQVTLSMGVERVISAAFGVPNINCSFCGSDDVKIYSVKENSTTISYYYRCNKCKHYRLKETEKILSSLLNAIYLFYDHGLAYMTGRYHG